MKTLFTLTLPVLVVATGVAGYIFFQDKVYMTSALFIVAAHLMAAYWIYTISNKKPVLG